MSSLANYRKCPVLLSPRHKFRAGETDKGVDQGGAGRRPPTGAEVVPRDGIVNVAAGGPGACVGPRVVARGDIVKADGIQRPAGNVVKGRVEKADRRFAVRRRLLINQGHKTCPERRRGAGADPGIKLSRNGRSVGGHGRRDDPNIPGYHGDVRNIAVLSGTIV